MTSVPASPRRRPLPAARRWGPVSSSAGDPGNRPQTDRSLLSREGLLRRTPRLNSSLATPFSLNPLEPNSPPLSSPQPRPRFGKRLLLGSEGLSPGCYRATRPSLPSNSSAWMLGRTLPCAPATLPANSWIPTARSSSTAAGYSGVGTLTCSARLSLCS